MTNVIKLKPLPVERDAYGQWVHPVYQEEWYKTFGDDSPSQEQAEAFCRDLGVIVETKHLEDDYNASEFNKRYEDGEGDLTDWNPEVPEGYFLVGIWDTDNTPVAVFAKGIMNET